MIVAAFDVSKLSLVYADGQEVRQVANVPEQVDRVLQGFARHTTVAMEATGRFHRMLAERAHALGFEVVVADPRRVKAFIRSTQARGKTDRTDAQALARYVQSQGASLRRYRPPPEAAERVRQLARERQLLVDAKARLAQGMQDSAEALARACQGLDEAIALLDDRLKQTLEPVQAYRRLLGIPGVGPVVAAGFLGLLMSFEFPTSDAFVAYLGLDPKANDSGARKGRRTISHRGDALCRKLAYLAGMAGRKTTAWKAYADSQRAKGLSGTEVALIVGRKIARTAWSLYTHETDFHPERVSRA